MALDLHKPVRCCRGNEAKIEAIEDGEGYPLEGQYLGSDGRWVPARWTKDGRIIQSLEYHGLNLINTEEVPSGYEEAADILRMEREQLEFAVRQEDPWLEGGGPAFPAGGDFSKTYRGMALRDWFAGMIAQGLLASLPDGPGASPKATEAIMRAPETAYALADRMLAAREKKA